MNLEALYSFVQTRIDEKKDRDYLPFLLALYSHLETRNEIQATLENLPNIIDAALTGAPTPHPVSWFLIEDPPSLSEENNGGYIGMDYTLEVIKFQISECQQIKDTVLTNPHRHYGITSPNGHNWYNFTALSILECGLAGLIANSFSVSSTDASILGHILECGRAYE